MNLLNLGIVNFSIREFTESIPSTHQNYFFCKSQKIGMQILESVRLGDSEGYRFWHSEGHPIVGTRML